MSVTDEQPDEKRANPISLGAKPAGEESRVEPEAGPSPEETGKQRDGEPLRRAKRRPVIRWIVILLMIGLMGAGYAYRMRLIALVSKDSPRGARAIDKKVLYWVDPMHPAYKSDRPGKATDCGMDLVPVYAEETTGVKPDLPEGTIQISPEKQQLIGVRYGTAEFKIIRRTLRAVGRLTWDETQIVRIHPRIEGWIEKVFVDFIGKQVGKGQPLISIYSPELWQTQQEYLLALKGRDELANSPFREAVASSASLLEAARKRLELWDIDMDQLEHLEHTGKPFKALTLYAPSNGFVLTRNAFVKQRVTPETELYTIADLSTIWVMADIYEYEAPEIKIGQPATVTLSYFPGRPYRGKVTYINPQLDNATRTLKVRVEIANPDFALKPDMFVNVELGISYGRQIVVPQEAVLDSGAEQMVFVAHEGGYFEPRKVRLGANADHEFIVLDGLKAGERIVTSANFLIDSESKLKAAAGGMGMPGMNHGGGRGGESNAPATQAPAAGKPALPPRQEDHSQHQPGAAAPPRPKPDDHSQHQPKKQE
ncbi:MAG: efflux RND transporter periplasmic adaptor subunit [Blastocatellia bacterium]